MTVTNPIRENIIITIFIFLPVVRSPFPSRNLREEKKIPSGEKSVDRNDKAIASMLRSIIILESEYTNHGIETSVYTETRYIEKKKEKRCSSIESYLQIPANRRINASCDKNRRRLDVFDFSPR